MTLFSQTSAYFNQTNTSESSTFDDGWEEGYKEAFEAYGLDAFIIPISPVVLANEADTYRAGYSRGYQKALEDLKD